MAYPKNRKREPFLERFWRQVLVSEWSNVCWPWVGYVDATTGYGRITVGHQKVDGAHRVSYQLLVGQIEPGLTIDHLCRNRICVNPEHLEQVTLTENLRRADRWELRKTHCPQGHEYSPENTYPFGKRRARHCITCARKRSAEFYLRTKETGK